MLIVYLALLQKLMLKYMNHHSREFPRNVREKLQISVNFILEIVTRVNDPFQKEIDFLIYPRIDGFTILPRSTYLTIQDFLFIEKIP